MSRFAAQITAGLASVATFAGVPVTYRRGAVSIPIPLAVPGKSDFRSDEQHNVVAESRSKDFIVSASLLVSGGQRILPQRGDTITDGAGNVYEVGRPDGSGQPWRYSDESGQTYIRIHTQLKVRAS